jgi:hypothetical protein
LSSTAAFGGRWVRLAKEGQQAAGVFVEVGKGVRDMRRKGPIKTQLVQQKAGNILP